VGRAIDNHPILKGLFAKRDNRFVTQAVDGAAHRGYQRWHRDLDDEVVEWIQNNPNKNGDKENNKGHAQRIAFVLQFGKFCELNRMFLNGDLP